MAYLIITLTAFNVFRIVPSVSWQILENNDHITPILHRIHFKIILITYKSINDTAPEYLSELVSIWKSSRKLRWSSQILLQVPASRLQSYGDCAFSIAAPTLWNRLPWDICWKFVSVIKTHLFKVAFTYN